MSCHGNNATPPGPAIAPGADAIDTMAVAAEIGRRGGIDPRIRALVPEWGSGSVGGGSGGGRAGGPFFQAGLAGYSDAAMRIIARRQGCPFCVTEALLDRILLSGGRGFAKADLESLADNIPGGDEDRPTAGQIIGSDPDEMAAAALKMIEQASRADREYRELAGEKWQSGQVAEWQSAGGAEVTSTLPLCHSATLPLPSSRTFAAIDVNLACPVKKIRNKARGGHWLADPQGAIEILRAVRGAVPREIPCTVKLRRGFDDTAEMARHFEVIFNAAYELGYAWATVHARTVEQRYLGPSRWCFLKDLVSRHPDKLIFGSGDVWDVHDIFRMIAYAGVHAVSVARGCIGNPWIFRQAMQMLRGEDPTLPTIAEQREVLEEHFRLALAVNTAGSTAQGTVPPRAEEYTGKTMRKFGIRFAVHHPRSEEVKRRMIAVRSVEDWRGVLEDLYRVEAEKSLQPRPSGSGSCHTPWIPDTIPA